MPLKRPRNYKQPSIVSGLSIDDILNMDINEINKLSEKEMKLVLGRLVSAVNKRVRRFQAKGISTPATVSLMRSGGALSVKGKNVNQMRKEFARARNFLNMETSTQKGYTKTMKKITETLKDRGITISPKDLDRVFAVWNRLVEIDPSIKLHDFKYSLWQDIAMLSDSMDIDDKIQAMQERYTELYEQQQETEYGKEVTLYGVSGFFEI